MTLVQQTPAQIQQALTANYNAAAALPANTGTGSALGAIFNAIMALAIQQQSQIAYVNSISRLATSTGADIDTFIAPFGMPNSAGGTGRNQAVASTGTVVFGTPSPAGSQIVIQNGTTVQTPSGTQFVVVADNSQPGYSSSNNGYLITVGSSSVNATVNAVVPGSSGNVLANQITQLISVPGYPAPGGVNSVNNVAAFTNGSDQESDSAVIIRFSKYMASRFATVGAVQAAVASVQSNLTYQVGDQIDPFGNSAPGTFCVIVNVIGQNSGPPNSVLTSVTNAVTAARPVGMPFTVAAPTLVPVTVSATLTLSVGAVASAVVTAANTAFSNYVNNIGLSPTNISTVCSFSKVTSALLAVSGVANVTNLLINGSAVDVTAPFGSQLVSSTATFVTQ